MEELCAQLEVSLLALVVVVVESGLASVAPFEPESEPDPESFLSSVALAVVSVADLAPSVPSLLLSSVLILGRP